MLSALAPNMRKPFFQAACYSTTLYTQGVVAFQPHHLEPIKSIACSSIARLVGNGHDSDIQQFDCSIFPLLRSDSCWVYEDDTTKKVIGFITYNTLTPSLWTLWQPFCKLEQLAVDPSNNKVMVQRWCVTP